MSDEEQQPKTDVVPQRFGEDEIKKCLHDLVRRKGLVGAAKALGVNFRTLTGSIDSGKLSLRMRVALLKVAQSGVCDDEEHQKEGEYDGQVEGLKHQVESLAAEVLSIRKELNAQAERIGELESLMSEPRTSSGPGTEAQSGVKEGSPKIAGSPSPGPRLPTKVVTLELRPHEQETFGAATPLVAEWCHLRTVGYVGSSRVEQARVDERRWELETEMVGEFGFTLPPETEPLPKSRRDAHLGWRKEALDRARRERNEDREGQVPAESANPGFLA